MAERLKTDFQAGQTPKGPKEDNTNHLCYILDEPALRSLFHEFLYGNFCEDNLSFWLEVQDFKQKFNITSSAIATGNTAIGWPSIGKGVPLVRLPWRNTTKHSFRCHLLYIIPTRSMLITCYSICIILDCVCTFFLQVISG